MLEIRKFLKAALPLISMIVAYCVFPFRTALAMSMFIVSVTLLYDKIIDNKNKKS